MRERGLKVICHRALTKLIPGGFLIRAGMEARGGNARSVEFALPEHRI